MNSGAELGAQAFRFDVTGVKDPLWFDGTVQLAPAIKAGGVVNAASNVVTRGLAPGSYISIYGTALSPAFRQFTTGYLPLSLAGVSVSFDVPDRNLSLPGRIHFVSDGQINVQIPWELQGLASVQMKVSIGLLQSALYNVPLFNYSPGLFEYSDNGRLSVAALDEGYRLIGSGNPGGARQNCPDLHKRARACRWRSSGFGRAGAGYEVDPNTRTSRP